MHKKKKKLLLIMPPQQGLLKGFATGLVSLANFVKRRMPDVRVDILDLSSYSHDKAQTEIVRALFAFENQTIFVGITTTTASYQSALKIARFAKKTDQRAIVVLGGHHASADPEVILRRHSDIVDIIIIGEGERSLCDLLYQHPLFESVSGLAYLDRDGRFTRTEAQLPLTQEELDSIPITYGDNDGHIGTPGKFDHVTYVSARGCPLQCAFCAVGNDRIRTKSIPVVVRDIEMLLDMGFCRIAIEDNFFAHSPTRTHDICKALANMKRCKGEAFSWDCQTRVESLVNVRTIDLMAKAGCEAVYIGVESLHPDQLKYLNKTKNPSKYLQTLIEVVVPSLLKTSIECYLNLQFGLPGEVDDHKHTTIGILKSLGKLAESYGKCITIFPQLHVLYPGTILFQKGIVQGRFPDDIFESFTEWEFNQSPVLYWLGEHFAHGTGGIPEGILKPDVLRNGNFDDIDEVVDTNAIFRISATLREINRIRGVRTFNYGDYIVTAPHFSDASSGYGTAERTTIGKE